ncbi:hypothetical protein Q1H02_06720 [Francisella tularensis subsp. mediasiatica]|nr:hypothetical protein Q1H04_01505 [Francisella tularensis subsp. mediasiatica]WKL78554.1 hypothetical protein Q1H02_06720 [Francisella tularensis subsp. mediasiatica]WKL80279.1 hypothetical protein Q1G99_07170 [Francisella tularensis subsp. mediasiatica]
MIKTIRYTDLGISSFYWLDTKHHFSFDGYYDPERMRFGHLRVINYDIVLIMDLILIHIEIWK